MSYRDAFMIHQTVDLCTLEMNSKAYAVFHEAPQRISSVTVVFMFDSCIING